MIHFEPNFVYDARCGWSFIFFHMWDDSLFQHRLLKKRLCPSDSLCSCVESSLRGSLSGLRPVALPQPYISATLDYCIVRVSGAIRKCESSNTVFSKIVLVVLNFSPSYVNF